MRHSGAAGVTRVAAVAVVFLFVSAGSARQSAAQETMPKFQGPGACQACHYQAIGVWKDRGVESFVAMTEANKWTEKDRHAQACNHIDPKQNELAARMYRNLGIENYEEEWTKQRQCLSCHANWLPEQEELPLYYTAGVSCESCHGPSSAWDVPHREVTWRLKHPVTEKEKEFGMIPVRHPVARAEQCFSCHIGNAAEQKVVTHAMYAAGHPPLPNIEIETFSRQMPSHWRYLPEKGDFQHRDEFVKLEYGSAEAVEDLPRTKAVVVGAAVALRFYLQLLASQETAEEKHQYRWPELAMYDCAGCHHELKSPSWRQQREDYGRGRPRMLEWPTLLAEHVSLPLLGDDAATTGFSSRMNRLRDLLSQRPFGPPPGAAGASLADVAGEFAEWLKQHEERLDGLRYDRALAEQAARRITEAGKAQLWDFYSGRQLAAAYQTVQLELQTPYPEFENVGTTPAQQAAGHLKQFEEWKCGPLSQQAERINQRTANLMLNQPLSLARLVDVACDMQSEPTVMPLEEIHQQRAEQMENASKYDARWFQERFLRLDPNTR